MKAKALLIVDDEPEIVELIQSLFSDQGWTVHTAQNGNEALVVFQQQNPSVILSDISMPDMDGLEFLEKVHELKSNTPVILLTGYRNMQKMQRAWAACVYDFIDKPFSDDEIILLVENAREYGEDYVIAARQRIRRYKKVS